MILSDKTEYAMIAVYGDDASQTLAKTVNSSISDRDIKVLTPGNPETLEQAAQNSVLILITIKSESDPNLALAGGLKENRLVTGDLIACLTGSNALTHIEIMARGFDSVVTVKESGEPSFGRFLQSKIAVGNRRLSALILEEEYRRLSDTISNAPASMIIFDEDKRCVFVSDHYFRAYPRIADKITRGISVYDAFDLMTKEEGMPPDDPLYARLQHFWYNLEGTLEFTLDRGTSYRLKAVRLPNKRGILVMAHNISNYRARNIELENTVAALQKEIDALKD
jgi:hypothetical protein